MKNTLTLLTCSIALMLLAPTASVAQSCGNRGGCGASQQAVVKTGVEAEDEHCHWLEVKSVVPDNAAASAGVKAGDVLVRYDGRTVGCQNDLNLARAAVKTESVPVVFRRGDKEMNYLLPKGKLGVFLNEWRKDVVPDPDAKIIKGVPALGWETEKMNTFMGALDAILKQQGAAGDYVFLCGASGAAFRTQFFATWCPSSPDPTCGFDAAEAALAACGYEPTVFHVSSDGKNKPAVLKAVRASIDAGMPVLAIDLIEMPEWGVITGYQKNGDELFCRTYFDKRKGYELAQKYPWAVYILEKAGKAPDEKASIKKSFGIVAENLSAEKYGEYYSGLAAFKTWTQRLSTDDFSAMDSTKLANAVQANNWIFDRIIRDRKTGMQYLDRIAEEMPELEPEMSDLTALYRQEVDLLEPVLDSLPCPGSVTRGEQWTQEIKMKEIQCLTQARAFEEQALAIWKELAQRP
jgi:hypothetical protein